MDHRGAVGALDREVELAELAEAGRVVDTDGAEQQVRGVHEAGLGAHLVEVDGDLLEAGLASGRGHVAVVVDGAVERVAVPLVRGLDPAELAVGDHRDGVQVDLGEAAGEPATLGDGPEELEDDRAGHRGVVALEVLVLEHADGLRSHDDRSVLSHVVRGRLCWCIDSRACELHEN